MARYYKKSFELLDKYDSYMVTGKEDSRGFTPAANLEVTSTRERNYPNFDFSKEGFTHDIWSSYDPFSTVTKNTGLSSHYLSEQILNNMDGRNSNNGDLISKTVSDAEDHESYDNDRKWKTGIEYAKSVSKLKKTVRPTELFTTEPRKTTITSAVFDPSLKHAMPIVGAMVHQEHGIPITADESLSTASSKLARNAQKKGLPVMGHEGNPTFQQNNYASGGDFYFSDQEEQDEVMDDFVEIHPDKVREAKNHLRGLLGREPKQHMSNQFKNVPLPGMEGF